MATEADVRIRRVGFRDGADDELEALHSIEAPIETERGSNRMPRSLAAYMAFARALPSQFKDTSWLVETPGGTPIAVGYCWYNSAGDERVMECDLLVRQDRRREGIASRLIALVCDETTRLGRSLLTWETFDAVPAGDAFSRRLSARAARVNRTSELVLADVDWAMVGRWSGDSRARELGYSLEMVSGPFPPHLRGDAAAFHHIMQSAPRDDLEVGDVVIDADFVAELDRALVDSRRTRWTLLVRDAMDTCVGGSSRTPVSMSRTGVLVWRSGSKPSCSSASATNGRTSERFRRGMPSRTGRCSQSMTLWGSRWCAPPRTGKRTSTPSAVPFAEGDVPATERRARGPAFARQIPGARVGAGRGSRAQMRGRGGARVRPGAW